MDPLGVELEGIGGGCQGVQSAACPDTRGPAPANQRMGHPRYRVEHPGLPCRWIRIDEDVIPIFFEGAPINVACGANLAICCGNGNVWSVDFGARSSSAAGVPSE